MISCVNTKKLFKQFAINTNFLNEDPLTVQIMKNIIKLC
jgi:hypothetical protein